MNGHQCVAAREESLERIEFADWPELDEDQTPSVDCCETGHFTLAAEPNDGLDEARLFERFSAPAPCAANTAIGGADTIVDVWAIERRPAAARIVPAIGGFELLEELGRGGMGVIYRARQLPLGRLVAVKFLHREFLSEAETVRRFWAEAEMLASLDHPAILPVYGVGKDDAWPNFVLKLAEGGSLDRQVPQLRDEPRRTAAVVSRLADAVEHVHGRGILHLDLKPSNVLLDLDGQAYLTDFGLARRVAGEDRSDAPDECPGTPNYMAPEQVMWENGSLSAATDVHGLGGILYELLTGRPPFRAATFTETLRSVLHRKPPLPRTVNPNVDQGLEAICLKCLEKNPEDRYASAGQVKADLQRWLAAASTIM